MALFLSMLLFSFSMSATPGPVNLITLSSGVNFGFKQTIPFVSGATIGFVLLLVAIGLGLGSVTNQFPILLNVFKYAGSAFVAYMGWSILRAKGKLNPNSESKPTFLQGALLQWLNPKAWIACLAGISAFNTSSSLQQLYLFACIYFVVCYFSIALWAFSGQKIQHLLAQPSYYRTFNQLMGSMLIGVAAWLAFFQ